MCQELLSDGKFVVGSPEVALKGWQICAPLGGTIKPLNDNDGVLLGTNRVTHSDGTESWEGALVAGIIEVIPSRRYRFQLDVRGMGQLTFGVLEYGWKHSSDVLNKATTQIQLSADRATCEFEYTPTKDSVSHVRLLISSYANLLMNRKKFLVNRVVSSVYQMKLKGVSTFKNA